MTTKLVWADDEPDQQEEERDNTVGELKEEASQGDSDFPSLAAAAKMPPPAKAAPKKKKKGQTLSLQELLNMPSEGGGRGGPAAGPLKDDRAILLSLPTSSKGKAEGDEERGGLGGAFKEYGGDRGRFGGRDDRRGPRGEGDGEGFQPSRADAVDDWGSTRQFQPSAGRPGGGGFGGGGGGGFRDREPRGDREREPRPFSQADTADDWGANRKFEPAHDDRDRRGGGGGFGGFRDAPRIDGPPRPRAGPMFDARPTRADEEDQWSRGREFQASERPGPRGSSGSREPPSGRQRGFGFAGEGRNPDAEDRWGRAPPQPQAAAAAPDAPAERPRLKLAPRTVPVEQAPAAPAVTSPTADKPAEKPAEEEPPKRRSNPFGEARPREEVLQEKVSAEPPKSAWGKPAAADAPAAPAPEEPAPAAAEAEPAAAPAAAPAEPAAAAAEPAAAPAPTVISLESPAERELKQTIAESQAELDKLQADPDADDEDVAEATTQLAALQAKLADMQAERALLEKKAAEAVAEDDGSGWVSAKPAKKAAATAAAAPAEPARPAATSPTGASGGRGGAWGASGPQGGRGRTGGFSDRDRPSGDRPSGDRPSGGPPRQGGAGDWPRGGARPVAAGAPGQERKW